MAQLGGSSIFLSATDGPIGQRESVPDFARVLSQYVDAVVLRTFQHENVVEFARWSNKPVINGLSDYYHPCQALGDLLTARECCGDLEGKTLAAPRRVAQRDRIRRGVESDFMRTWGSARPVRPANQRLCRHQFQLAAPDR